MKAKNPTNDFYRQKMVEFRESQPALPLNSYSERIEKHYKKLLTNLTQAYWDLPEVEFVESFIRALYQLLYETKLKVDPFSPEHEEVQDWIRQIREEQSDEADEKLVRYHANIGAQQSRRIYHQYLKFLEARYEQLMGEPFQSEMDTDEWSNAPAAVIDGSLKNDTNEPIKQDGLSYSEAALAFSYEEVCILSKEEAINEAPRYTFKHGFKSRSSAQSLVEKCIEVYSKADRMGPLESSNNSKQVKALKRRILKVLPVLTSGAQKRAKEDLKRISAYLKLNV